MSTEWGHSAFRRAAGGSWVCAPCAVAVLLGCGEPPPVVEAGTPVILVSIDTLRSDRLPAYGHRGVETPHLDRFTEDAVTFERAYSHYPLTLPSHASLLTGQLPPAHGVRENRGFALDPDHVTLAERLRGAGYRTGGVVSSMVIRDETGLAQGFEFYEDEMRGPETAVAGQLFAQRRGDRSVELALEWLSGLAPGKPFHLFLHLYDPHTPYEAPEPFGSRYAEAYDAEIAYSDELLGGLFDDLRQRKLYDRSLIVVLSDHGEGLGDHVETEHGLLLYRETLQVPLWIKLPGGERGGSRVERPVGLIDVMPTILELLQMDSDDLPGASLFTDAGDGIYSETFSTRYQYGWSELKSIIRGDLHYIHGPAPELYDLDRDPAERNNLLQQRPVPPAMLHALAAVGEGIETTADVSEEELERLTALGYVGGLPGDELEGDLSDPKDRIGEIEELWAQIDRIGKTEALGAERRVLELMETLAVRNEFLSRTIANNMTAAGRHETALRLLSPFRDSDQPATLQLSGEILTALGRLAEARARFERILEIDADYPRAHLGIGIVLMTAQRFGEAEGWLRRSLELDPDLAEAWNGLGAILATRNDVAGAIGHWRRAVELDPELSDAWFNLGLFYERAGDRQAAASALEEYVLLVDGPERSRAAAMLRGLRAPKAP